MYPIWKQCCWIMLLTLLGACFSLLGRLAPLPWAEPEIGPGEILVVDAKVLDPIWVDARDREEFSGGHIPGALHFDVGNEGSSLLDIIEKWLGEPRPIVVYCSDVSCGTSRKVAETLRENLPDAEIYSLKGGWDAWQN